jgi:hypothetical protein
VSSEGNDVREEDGTKEETEDVPDKKGDREGTEDEAEEEERGVDCGRGGRPEDDDTSAPFESVEVMPLLLLFAKRLLYEFDIPRPAFFSSKLITFSAPSKYTLNSSSPLMPPSIFFTNAIIAASSSASNIFVTSGTKRAYSFTFISFNNNLLSSLKFWMGKEDSEGFRNGDGERDATDEKSIITAEVPSWDTNVDKYIFTNLSTALRTSLTTLLLFTNVPTVETVRVWRFLA